MIKQIIFFPLLMSTTFLTTADQTFNMEDINASLQVEYQSQLVFQPAYKKPLRKKAPSKPRQVVTQKQKTAPQKARYNAPPISKPTVEELFEAANNGNVNLIGKLIRQGININSANNEQETALHIAAARGHYSAVIYLINHGANLHARTIKNWLPIHHATRFRHANIANYLVKNGSSPYAKTSDNLSAIDMAKSMKDQRLVRILGAK